MYFGFVCYIIMVSDAGTVLIEAYWMKTSLETILSLGSLDIIGNILDNNCTIFYEL